MGAIYSNVGCVLVSAGNPVGELHCDGTGILVCVSASSESSSAPGLSHGEYEPCPETSDRGEYEPCPETSDRGEYEPCPEASDGDHGEYEPCPEASEGDHGEYEPCPEASEGDHGEYEPCPEASEGDHGEYEPCPIDPNRKYIRCFSSSSTSPSLDGEYAPCAVSSAEDHGEYESCPEASDGDHGEYEPCPETSDRGEYEPCPEASEGGEYAPCPEASEGDHGDYEPCPEASDGDHGEYEPCPEASDGDHGEYEPCPEDPNRKYIRCESSISGTSSAAPEASSAAPEASSAAPVGSSSTFLADCEESCNDGFKETYSVTMSGLSGDFSVLNGTNDYDYDVNIGCLWFPGIFGATLTWDGAKWVISGGGGGCAFTFDGPTNPCDPTGTYSNFSCISFTCSDTDSCPDSAGATCTVA